jgi:glycosyltransferase involved in cell wall biosynthesis
VILWLIVSLKKMKKKVIIDIFYLQVAQTGIKTYTETLCGQVSKNSDPELEYVILPSYPQLQNSAFFKGKTPKWKNLLFQFLYFFWKQLVLPIKSYQHRADIIFCPDIIVPVWGRGKKIAVIHDAFFWESPEHYQPLWRKYYLAMLNLGLKGKAQVVTITEYSKSRLKQFLPEGTRIDVALPATHLIKKEGFTAQEPFSGPYFLHVGVMEKRKNLGMLVEAFEVFHRKNPEVKLVLVGQRGPRVHLDDFDRIFHLVHSKGLGDSVLIPGFVSAEELQQYYANALAYVFPSQNEGFGLPVLEAFSYGLPVIITPQGALKEVGGEAVLVAENSPEKLAEKMEEVYEDRSLRERLAEAGSQRLRDFSPEKFFGALQEIFKKK